MLRIFYVLKFILDTTGRIYDKIISCLKHVCKYNSYGFVGFFLIIIQDIDSWQQK